MPYQFGTASCRSFLKSPNLTHQIKGDDPFICLNDDIIVSHILSRLPLEDAVRTSVLCHRWKKLWTESTGSRLIFSYSLDRLYNPHHVQQQDVIRLTPVLANGISHVLETYLHPKLEELTICFDFDSSFSHSIDSWIENALKKGVTQLVLDFSRWISNVPKVNYNFPDINKLLLWCAMSDNKLHQPINHGDISNLRDIRLKSVNVSGEVIEFLLSNCPLEHLCVWESKETQEIRVCKEAIKLKSLEFVDCKYTKTTISSPHLVSLQYKGLRNRLSLLHVPLLSELSIGSGLCRHFLRNSSLGFGYIFTQIKRLELDLNHKSITESHGYSLEFPEFLKLEQLDVRLQACSYQCLLWPIILIKAAPLLHTFLAKLHTQLKEHACIRLWEENFGRNLKIATKQVHHRRLKVIKMYGFSGQDNEVELGENLLGVSDSLEEFVVRPLLPGNRQKPHPGDDISSTVKKHRELAQQFKTWLPSNVKLVIL